jgi:hypothetical protein
MLMISFAMHAHMLAHARCGQKCDFANHTAQAADAELTGYLHQPEQGFGRSARAMQSVMVCRTKSRLPEQLDAEVVVE